jgi:dTDP-4-dehydrorhamnose reductase
MKILILGASGMLGHKLYQKFQSEFDTFATIRGRVDSYAEINLFKEDYVIDQTDVSDINKLKGIIESLRPDVIINCIGIIKQLKEAQDVLKSLELNSMFPHLVARIAASAGARFITFSTDCVFDGADGNYTEDDLPNATDIYGKTKYLGEVNFENSLTLRTSIIGRELNTTNSLVEWFLGNRGGQVKGYKKAIYSGFPTVVMSKILVDLIRNHKNLSGVFHLSSEPIDKYELLQLIKAKTMIDIEIEPYADFSIDRSLRSDKFREATGFVPLDWENMIDLMVDDATPYDQWRKLLLF